MYYQVISQCTQYLKRLETWLDKAEQHAAARNFDIGVLLRSRLAPDMLNLTYQVQVSCDLIEAAAAWLSGQTPPGYKEAAHEGGEHDDHKDHEQTIDELRTRIRKAVAFAESVKEAQYKDASARKIKADWVPGKAIRGEDYLLEMTIPNLFFHLVTAYDIMRHNGVVLGKLDFLGSITLVDA